MTTIELFHRVGRRARGADFTSLSMSEQTDILMAINGALMEVYNALPQYFKEITEGFVLPPPRTLNLSVTQYSANLSSSVFSPEELGRSVVIAGDTGWNQVVATNQLLNPYLGATGTAAATVYGDAVYSQRYPFDRIIGNPRFANPPNGYYPVNAELQRKIGVSSLPMSQTVGRPYAWEPLMLGNSQGNNPLLVIKVAPAPDIAYSINVRMSYWPKRLTQTNYSTASDIPVPDQFINAALIPLCMRNLMQTPIWVSKSPADDLLIDKVGMEAVAFLRLQPGQQAPNNRSYTPIGY